MSGDIIVMLLAPSCITWISIAIEILAEIVGHRLKRHRKPQSNWNSSEHTQYLSQSFRCVEVAKLASDPKLNICRKSSKRFTEVPLGVRLLQNPNQFLSKMPSLPWLVPPMRRRRLLLLDSSIGQKQDGEMRSKRKILLPMLVSLCLARLLLCPCGKHR